MEEQPRAVALGSLLTSRDRDRLVDHDPVRRPVRVDVETIWEVHSRQIFRTYAFRVDEVVAPGGAVPPAAVEAVGDAVVDSCLPAARFASTYGSVRSRDFSSAASWSATENGRLCMK